MGSGSPLILCMTKQEEMQYNREGSVYWSLIQFVLIEVLYSLYFLIFKMLFSGMAGSVYFLADILEPKSSRFPAFEI